MSRQVMLWVRWYLPARGNLTNDQRYVGKQRKLLWEIPTLSTPSYLASRLLIGARAR